MGESAATGGCEHITLAKSKTGQVAYCAECESLVLSVGFISLRLTTEALEGLSALLQSATTNLRNFMPEQAVDTHTGQRPSEMH